MILVPLRYKTKEEKPFKGDLKLSIFLSYILYLYVSSWFNSDLSLCLFWHGPSLFPNYPKSGNSHSVSPELWITVSDSRVTHLTKLGKDDRHERVRVTPQLLLLLVFPLRMKKKNTYNFSDYLWHINRNLLMSLRCPGLLVNFRLTEL